MQILKIASLTAVLSFLIFGISLADAANFEQITQDIQAKLLEYGYDPGPDDGLFGGKTERAIRQFQTEFRLPINGEAGLVTATFLGVTGYSQFEDTKILVLNENSESIARNITGREHADVLNYLSNLEQSNLSKIDMIFLQPKAVVFIINEELQPGDIVFTQIEVIRLDGPKFIENFYYEITEGMPLDPLIIINDAEAGWELQFTHRVYLNGELIDEKRTRAAR